MGTGRLKLALAGFVVVVIVFLLLMYRIYSRNNVDLMVSKGNMINILFMGSNRYSSNKMSFYAIVSINPENNRIGITFLPPTLKVDMSGDGDLVRIDQINSRDFRNLSQYIFNSLNLRINFFVSFYAPDVERVVNLIDGIHLYLVDQVKNMDGTSVGKNYLDGKKIVQYINQTSDNTIYRKYDRIQDVLFTLYYQKDMYKEYANPVMIGEAMRTIRSNISPAEARSLIRLVQKNGDMMCTMLPGKVTPEGDYIIDEVAYKIYENEFLKKLVIKRETEPNIRVKVLNASGVTGLARKMRAAFVREGITVVEFGTYPGSVLNESVIIDQSGNIETVRKISELTGTKQVYHIIDSSQISSVVFIVGKDLAE